MPKLELIQFNINGVIIESSVLKNEFGDIPYDPVLKISGINEYIDLDKAMAKTAKESYSKPEATSPPSVISNAISKVLIQKIP